MKHYSMLLRLSFALLLAAVAIALVRNLPVFSGGELASPRIPVHAEDHTLRFVIVAPLYDHPFWGGVWQGARGAEGSLNINVDMVGPRRASLADQIALLDMSTAAQVDGIITQGVQHEQFAAAIAKAVDRGIPVITVDTDVPGRRLSYVGVDHYIAGRLAAVELLERSGGQAVVAIVRGGVGSAEEDERVRGFREGLADWPAIRIAAVEASELNRTIAGQKALQILDEHPGVTAFYGTTAQDTAGIAQSLTALGAADRILIVGAVEESPLDMGRTAVTLLEAYLRRDIRPPERVEIPISKRSGGGTK